MRGVSGMSLRDIQALAVLAASPGTGLLTAPEGISRYAYLHVGHASAIDGRLSRACFERMEGRGWISVAANGRHAITATGIESVRSRLAPVLREAWEHRVERGMFGTFYAKDHAFARENHGMTLALRAIGWLDDGTPKEPFRFSESALEVLGIAASPVPDAATRHAERARARTGRDVREIRHIPEPHEDAPTPQAAMAAAERLVVERATALVRGRGDLEALEEAVGALERLGKPRE